MEQELEKELHGLKKQAATSTEARAKQGTIESSSH